MNNDQRIIDLLKSRAVVQRRLRDNLEDLEAVTNEIENEIARVEGREAVRKMIDLRFRDVTGPRRGEQT
jgi:DNA-directed RNA polymerase specialized sigma subunit